MYFSVDYVIENVTPVLLCVGRRVTTPSAPALAPTVRKPIAARTWRTPAKRPEKQVHALDAVTCNWLRYLVFFLCLLPSLKQAAAA